MVSRRTLLQTVVFATLAAGCGQGTPISGGTSGSGRPTTAAGGGGVKPSPSATEVRVELARAVVGTDPTAGAAMLGAFAGSLLGEALKRQTGNLILSPWSITVAFGMNRAGAAGRTAEQIDAAMHTAEAARGLDEALNTSAQLLDSRNEKVETEVRKGEIVLRSANSTWAAPGLTWKRPFLETLAKYYGSGVRLTDFARDPEAARTAINAWVTEHTAGKIPELVPKGAIDNDTLIAVVNALYFKAPWAEAFDRDLNVVRDFTLADGTVKRAPMMRTILYDGHGRAGDGWAAGTVPYLGGQLAFTVVLPDKGRETQVRAWLSGKGFTELLRTEGTPLVDLTIPKFRFRSTLPLKEVLIALGVRDAFVRGVADYSGMTDDETIYVSAALHQATIGIDEEGTEATAATAFIGGRGGAGPEPLTIVLDRPFYLVIHDLETRIPLFVGHVADPTDES
jgi:serpin B